MKYRFDFKGLTKFQRLKQYLQSEWGVKLQRGNKDLGPGFSTGFVINAPWGMTRYRTLVEIERAIKNKGKSSVE